MNALRPCATPESIASHCAESAPIDVRIVRTDASDAECAQLERLLSEHERQRAARFLLARSRSAYVATRGALRLLLAPEAARPAAALEFAYGNDGKPRLAADAALAFNVSHSGTLAVIAVTRHCELGIDIEVVRPVAEMESLAKRFFCKREYDDLFSLGTVAERQRAFFACWTRKEAFVKAGGEGFSLPLDRFCVTLAPGEGARLTHVDNDEREGHAWSVHDLAIAPGYAGALVYRAPRRLVRLSQAVSASALLAGVAP